MPHTPPWSGAATEGIRSLIGRSILPAILGATPPVGDTAPAPLPPAPMLRTAAHLSIMLSGLALTLPGCFPDPRGERVEDKDALAEAMGEHATLGVQARAAIEEGRLADARVAGAELATRLRKVELPAKLSTHRDAAALAADRLTTAIDAEVAGEALGELSAQCGMCHLARGAEVGIPAVAAPVQDGSLPRQMQLHRWASQEIWAGLVTADPPRIKLASEQLATTPLLPTGATEDSPQVPPEAAILEVQVHDAAASAARATDPLAQGRALGRMLAACASCHHRLHGGPAAAP